MPNQKKVLACVIVMLLLTITRSAHADSFNWPRASPESQGFNRLKLDTMVNVLAARRTRSVLIIRNDRIVKEWYAPGGSPAQRNGVASMAKALVGGMALMVALNDGRIHLEDYANKYVLRWRSNSVKSKINIRQLVTHTSGVEDADGPEPWKKAFWDRIPDPFTVALDRAPIIFPPGSDFAYSNPGFAALAYAVTASLKSAPQKDILTVLSDRIMNRIGVARAEWSIGYGRYYQVDGLKLYATWGGASYTTRAIARVARLMLRHGNWQGQQLVSSTWASRMTTQVDSRYHTGLGWWTNAGGEWPSLPRDAFIAAGSGHQVLLVVPSRNLIAVRVGQSLMSEADFWAGIEEYLFEPLMASMG